MAVVTRVTRAPRSAAAEATAAQLQAETHQKLRDEVARLESTRTELATDVESMARHLESERFGGLQVDDELEFGGLHDRQVGRLLALENAAGIDAGQTVQVRNTGSVAHQAAGRRERAKLEDRGHRVADRQCGELFAPVNKESIGADHERTDSPLEGVFG